MVATKAAIKAVVRMMIVDVMEVATVVATKVAVVATKEVVGVDVVIGALLPILIPLVRFATYMGILQKIVGGIMEMISVIMETVGTKVPTLLLMELTPIGTMIPAPLIISLGS